MAISEILGTLIMIGITLVAGAAAFGFVNGESGNSQKALGNQVATNINYLNERFTLVTEQIPSTSCSGVVPTRTCGSANLWIYNNGAVGLTLFSINIKNSSATTGYLNAIFYQTETSCPTGDTCGPTGSGSNWIQSGYIEYNQAGTSISTCTSATGAGGFTPATNSFLTKSSMRQYSITLPTGAGCSQIYVGQSYTILMTGLYGSQVQTTILVSA